MFSRFPFSLFAAAALALAPLSASALGFTVTQFSKNDLASAQADFAGLIGPNWAFSTTESFENPA